MNKTYRRRHNYRRRPRRNGGKIKPNREDSKEEGKEDEEEGEKEVSRENKEPQIGVEVYSSHRLRQSDRFTLAVTSHAELQRKSV